MSESVYSPGVGRCTLLGSLRDEVHHRLSCPARTPLEETPATIPASCVHDLDSVLPAEPLLGERPDGAKVTVLAGTAGVVVAGSRAADWYEVEIDRAAVGEQPVGTPFAFVGARSAQLTVTRLHRELLT